MADQLSLLVVDVSEDWEEVLKAQERGYTIDWQHRGGGYVKGKLDPNELMILQYPHGLVRAGFNAITDTARIAHQKLHVPIYAAEYSREGTDGEEQVCFSLQQYIPKENRYEKSGLSALRCA